MNGHCTWRSALILAVCIATVPFGNKDRKMRSLKLRGPLPTDSLSPPYMTIEPIEETLCKSCANGDLEYVTFLVDMKGADPLYDNSRPLYLAATRGHIEIVQYFLKHKRKHGVHNYTYAARKTISTGHKEIVQLLLDAVDYRCRRTVSVLTLKALRKQQVEIFQMLLERFKPNLIPLETISTECIYRDNISIFRVAVDYHCYDDISALFMFACEQFAGEIVGHLLERYKDISLGCDAERLIDLMILDVEDAITPHILNDDRFKAVSDSERRLLPKLIQSDRLSSVRIYLRKDDANFHIDHLVLAFTNHEIDSSDREVELFRLLLAHSSDTSKFILYSEPFAKQTMHYKMACLGYTRADDEKFVSVFGKLASQFGSAEFAVRCAVRHQQWELFREALYALSGHVGSLLYLWKWQEERLFDTLEFCSKAVRKSGDRKLLRFFVNSLVEQTSHQYDTSDKVEQVGKVVQKAKAHRLFHLQTITNGIHGYMALSSIFNGAGLEDVSEHVLDYHLFNLLIH